LAVTRVLIQQFQLILNQQGGKAEMPRIEPTISVDKQEGKAEMLAHLF